MKKEEYLRCVTDQIRCKKACPGIEKELEDHITDQAEMYLKKGMTEEQALKKAIAEMVAPDKKTLKKSVKSMFFMVQTRCEVETIKY